VVLDNGDLQFGHPGCKSLQYGPAGVITRVTGAPVAMSAEEPLVDCSLVGQREGASPIRELMDRVGCFFDHELHDSGIPQQVSLFGRVGEVLLP
jgi:hypothetical protein